MGAVPRLLPGLLAVGHGLVDRRGPWFAPAGVRTDPGTGEVLPTTHRVAGVIGGAAAVRRDSAAPAQTRPPSVSRSRCRCGQQAAAGTPAPRSAATIRRVGTTLAVDAATSAQLSEGITL